MELQSVEDLAGLKVGAQMGSIQEEKAKELAETTGFTYESRRSCSRAYSRNHGW